MSPKFTPILESKEQQVSLKFYPGGSKGLLPSQVSGWMKSPCLPLYCGLFSDLCVKHNGLGSLGHGLLGLMA